MMDHISLGVRSTAISKPFYDAVLGALGYRCLKEDAESLGYGDDAPQFWILKVDRPIPADPGSGLHFCFIAPSEASVDTFHQAALENGGRDNGAPGLRPDYGPGYYASFVLDLDGYRLEAYHSSSS